MTTLAELRYIADSVRIAHENGAHLCREGHPACSHLFNGPCHVELLARLSDKERASLESFESPRENDR